MVTANPLLFDTALLSGRDSTAKMHEKIRRLLGLAEGQPLPAETLAELAWREANVDNADPVLRAMARAPLADEPC